MKRLFIFSTFLLCLLSTTFSQQSGNTIKPNLKYGKPSKEELTMTSFAPDTTATAYADIQIPYYSNGRNPTLKENVSQLLTCDEHGETNLGFYNFDTEDWSFLSEADQSYRDSEFVWIYPPADQMKEFLIKSIKAERESAPPSSKENWFRKKTQPIKKKITLAFKKK